MSNLERGIWWALWPASLGYLALIMHLAPRDVINPSQPMQFIAAYSFIVAGQLAWARRPKNPFGVLMVITGFVYLEVNLGLVEIPTLWAVFDAANRFEAVLIPHLLLAYPYGRVEARLPRALLGVDYAAMAVFSTVYLLTDNPRLYFDCNRCLVNAFGLIEAQGLHDLVDTLKNVVPAVIAVVVFAVIIARLIKSTPTQRRALAPLWIAAANVCAVFVAWTVFNALPHSISTKRTADNAINAAVIGIPLTFFIGIMRMRFARGAVGSLVIELGSALPPGRLRDALARSLGDPSLEIAFPLPDASGYVDLEGRPVSLPAGYSGRAVTFVESEGAPLAALIHDQVLTDAKELVDSVVAAARLALENERLQAEVRAQLEEVRASRARMLEASDEARRRIERDLHDGAQQRLLSLALSLRMAREQIVNSKDEIARKVLEEAEVEMRGAISELRELAQGIHPAVLTEQGLAPAIEMLAEKATLPVHVGISDERFPPTVEATAYFVVSEALSNVVKYAQATRIKIRGERVDRMLVIEVADDGIGGADPSKGTGLRGLGDRVTALEGRLSVASEVGRGTVVRAELPLGR